MTLVPLAFIDAETLAVGIPFVIFMIPIIAILTNHQRKMAEIIHGKAGQAPAQNSEEIQALRAEVYELKQLVQTQMIALDSMSQAPMSPRTTPPPSPEIEQRLRS